MRFTLANYDILSTNQDDINEIVNLVCMYYARLSSNDERYQNFKSKDLSSIADFYGLKLSTVNNYKDYYDALYDNGRKGWYQRSPESYPKLYVTYNKYKELSIETHAQIKDDIMNSIERACKPYFSIKTKDSKTVDKILSKSSSVVFSGLNVHKDKLKLGQIVFIVLGGDNPKWNTGLVGMGVITQEPFDLGYEGNNFRLGVDVRLLLSQAIKRADLVQYKDTYNIIGIGPITKWEPNQALSQIEPAKAIALMRAMLDMDKSIENELSNLVSQDVMLKIMGALPMYREVMVEYGGGISNEDCDPAPVLHNSTLESMLSVNSIIRCIESTGLQYDPILIKRFAFSLMTKPFVILSGLAGSGKTQLALAFAKTLIQDESQMCVVPVGADWTNREPLLGYPNALDNTKYQMPESGVLRLLIEANKEENSSRPYFLILDEMNMSYVERYFADFLSAMESKESIKLWDGVAGHEVPQAINVPKNVYIIGTINVDETTYMFSPKVLDRANVIEFKISSLEMRAFLSKNSGVKITHNVGSCASMAKNFVNPLQSKEISVDESIGDTLVKFFEKLKSVNAEFGYRSASEIYKYIDIAKSNDDSESTLTEDMILDSAIVQKLLPKLHGSRKKLESVLNALWSLSGASGDLKNAEIDVANAKYPLTADKVARMYRSAIDNGFTSFSEA